MKKVLAVVLGIGVIIAVIFLGMNKKGRVSSITTADLPVKALNATDEGEYDTHLSIKRSAPGEKDMVLLSLDGEYAQAQTDSKEFVTEWKTIQKFVVNDQLADPAVFGPLLHQKTVTQLIGGVPNHLLPPDFPREFYRIQLGVMDRIFLFVPLADHGTVDNKEMENDNPYNARYTFAKDGANTLVDKVWVSYDKGGAIVSEPNNSLRYIFSETGRLLAIEGKIRQHFTSPASDIDLQMSVRLKGAHPAKAEKAALAKDKLKPLNAQVVQQADYQAAAERGMSFEEAYHKLDTITDKSDGTDVYHVFVALKDNVRIHPEYGDRLVKRILDTKERDPSARRQLAAMFGALAQSKNPHFADELGNIAEQCSDNFCKVQAIVGLNDHTNPTPQSAAKMLEMGQRSTDPEIAGAALLAVGSMAHKMDSTPPETAKVILDVYNDPAKANIKTTTLAAMGNYGNPTFLPTLEDGLKSQDPSIRSSAAYSLRNIQDAGVNPALVNFIQNEKSAEVIKEAMKATAYRQLTADEYQKIAAKTATIDDHQTQEEAARALAGAYKGNPQAVEGALKTFKEKTKYANVKVLIDTEMKNANGGGTAQ